MPENGNNWLSRSELLSWEEMLRLCTVFTSLGVSKIRLTGGEPFVRKGIMPFVEELAALPQLTELTVTTNGVLTAPLTPQLKRAGIRSVNLSLDTLDRQRFLQITRRDELPQVIDTLHALLAEGIAVKVNAVVMEGKNIYDIPQLAELTRQLPVDVRFIEEMPFNGGEQHYTSLTWDHTRILRTLEDLYPGIHKITDPEHSTAYNYSIPGHKGTIGIIAAYTRSFCGTCNRIRLTPQGILKTCLYDNGGLDLKTLLRSGATDEQLTHAIVQAVQAKAADGHEAERQTHPYGVHQSMATIGG